MVILCKKEHWYSFLKLLKVKMFGPDLFWIKTCPNVYANDRMRHAEMREMLM